ncbi:DUF262 domain-containing HNH endonuclease family protein [Thiothrix lacustris]|uniref:DUF262 domain-containing HNH endonuclease family protein n=1 Tax=Thiothrix lacustris TaxID=525917 RepID=A0ABY9MMN4_9GAMM|nr:DUF262 domain-containing HNH endonuclease family protein [Thiothrix lacustris]WML89909.1 DUF262 domain-containing HNH endonuclease family protein [Thiothrix lacustris]
MEKVKLSSLLEDKIFRIPDYQRGYSWDDENWLDFVQDIDALIEEDINSHYTGTIVIYKSKDNPVENYGNKKLELVDVVDGQQRLTTCSLYLSVILKELIIQGEVEFSSEISSYLYNGVKSKLRLNNDSSDFYYDLISRGTPNTTPNNIHQQRLHNACVFFRNHIHKKDNSSQESLKEYLGNLFDAIIRKLNFSFYTIDVESEIGMTFELMNSRGKKLSTLELLKNYLMHWVYRNVSNENEREDLTKTINKAWKEVYVNLSNCNGNEDQCLRISWILYQNHTPKNWKGYDGFKENDVIPLRDFSKKSKNNTKEYIYRFVNGLAIVSKHYAEAIKPSSKNSIDEYTWLTKIRRIGNMANFLPLIIAAKIKLNDGKTSSYDYINLLKALENSAYRVFLWESKRSNTGLSAFYKWGFEIFAESHSIVNVTEWIYGHTNWYSNENSFRNRIREISNWYSCRRLLKYSLYEYELFLLENEGKNTFPDLRWEDLSDATIEHILPQNPDEHSLWHKTWDKKDAAYYLHDISNLVLTRNNSNYLNFDFERKKGHAGQGYCYANSDIRQERKLAGFSTWDIESCKKRRQLLEDWVISRWGVEKHYILPAEINEEEDDDLGIEDI